MTKRKWLKAHGYKPFYPNIEKHGDEIAWFKEVEDVGFDLRKVILTDEELDKEVIRYGLQIYGENDYPIDLGEYAVGDICDASNDVKKDYYQMLEECEDDKRRMVK